MQRSLNLLRQGESEVENGNLLTLPIGGGLLYVQPVYVRSAGETSYPLLQHVLVAFGEDIGFAPTLDEALDQVFGGDSGASAGDAGTEDAETANQDPLPAERRGLPVRLAGQGPQRRSAGGEEGHGGLRCRSEGRRLRQYGKAQDRLKKALEDAVAPILARRGWAGGESSAPASAPADEGGDSGN